MAQADDERHSPAGRVIGLEGAHATSFVEVNGFPVRVWSKGTGAPIGFLAGFGGLPRWTPFLDDLAASRRVIVPSLPGFPGGDRGHTVLDTHIDWVVAVRHILVRSGLDGSDLVGSSLGASLLAEVAAVWPESVRRLVLTAPFGLFDERDPPADPWALRPGALAALMCDAPATWRALCTPASGPEAVEWPIEQQRASEAAARIFWPLGNTRLERRLPLIAAPTLLLWGERDRVVPRGYAERIARLIGRETRTRIIADAGHLAELDRPAAVADAVLTFCS